MLLVTAIVDRLGVLGGISFVGASRKRKVSAFASMVSSERLEDRALMSAVMDTGAEAADVSTATKSPKGEKASAKYAASADLGDGFEGDTATVKVKKNGNVTVSTLKFKGEDGKVALTLNFSKGKTSGTDATINVKGAVTDPVTGKKVKFSGTGTADVSDTSFIDIAVLVPAGILADAETPILDADSEFTVTLALPEAGAVSKSKPNVAGTFDVTTVDEDDNEVTSGVLNITQKGKKIEGQGDEDSGIGKIKGTLKVKKGEVKGLHNGTIEITGENADGNPKKVKAPITKFLVNFTDGTFVAVAHLPDGLGNFVGRDVIINGTIA